MPRDSRRKKAPFNARRAADLGLSALGPHGGKRAAQADVTDASTECPSYSTLPRDVLLIIFSHFDPYPLVATVSLVCKRWRAAALECVTALDEFHFVSAEALPLLTHLHTLAVSRPVRGAPLTLRHLALRFNAEELDRSCRRGECPISCHLTHLDRLESFEVSITSQCRCWLPLLQRNRLTLRTLTFVLEERPKSLNLAIAMPSLTSLAFRNAEGYSDSAEPDGALELILLHASQLTSLRVDSDPLSAGLPLLPDMWPRLRTLQLAYDPLQANANFANLVKSAPSLTSLSVACQHMQIGQLPFPDQLAHVLDGLSYSSIVPFPAVAQFTSKRLKRLCIDAPSKMTNLDHALQLIAHTLEALDLRLHLSVPFKLFPQCANLRELSLDADGRFVLSTTVSQQPLPSLQHLNLTLQCNELSKVLSVLRAFLKATPELRSVRALLPRATTRKDAEELAAYLELAERAGVASARFVVHRRVSVPLLQAVARRFRWLRVVVQCTEAEAEDNSSSDCSEEWESDE